MIDQNPDLVERANEIAWTTNLGYLKNCLELGVDFVFITGDFAMTKGPFVSPKHTRRFMTPALKKQVDLAHSMDVPVLKHTDGNIWKIRGRSGRHGDRRAPTPSIPSRE